MWQQYDTNDTGSPPPYGSICSHKASLAANAIAENLFAQIDDEGNRHVLFDEIVAVNRSYNKTLQRHITPKQRKERNEAGRQRR